ncbi:gluconokinase [Actinophytocola sp.]|uniref:gluconokinase n=1 Tax=Actinophytocola sp. TaxID=1872138 RepID=UPI003D6A5123
MPPVVVMGVTGSGKTTVGVALAERLGVPFGDADDFHPRVNVDKMSAGEPLDDDDRQPWLRAIGEWLAEHSDTGAVVTCSALKRAYRDTLRDNAPSALFVHLHGDQETVRRRVADRSEHFMPESLVDSQFAALEPLRADERGVVLELDASVADLVTAAARSIVD